MGTLSRVLSLRSKSEKDAPVDVLVVNAESLLGIVNREWRSVARLCHSMNEPLPTDVAKELRRRTSALRQISDQRKAHELCMDLVDTFENLKKSRHALNQKILETEAKKNLQRIIGD